MRGGIKITRSDYHEREPGDKVDWIDDFANKLHQIAEDPRTAVEAARARDQQSLLDQIVSIVSRQHGQSGSVEDKVRELQDRTGLSELLRRRAQQTVQALQKAAEEGSEGEVVEELPEGFKSLPNELQDDIKNYIRNKIDTHHGNIQVPAIVEDVSKTFRLHGVQPHDVNDTRFERYVSNEIVKAKKREPSFDEHNVNIGRGVGTSDKDNSDAQNSDVFEGLMPAKT